MGYYYEPKAYTKEIEKSMSSLGESLTERLKALEDHITKLDERLKSLEKK